MPGTVRVNITLCCFYISFLNISPIGNEKATSFRRKGRIPERKQEASLKEIDTKNCPRRVMLQPPLLLSHLQQQKKN